MPEHEREIMSGTKRNLADLTKMFSVGKLGDIAASNLRDFLVSVFNDMGYGSANATTAAEIKDAVDKKHANTLDHIQNTDQKLDEGGDNEVVVADIKDTVDKKHEHSNKTILDAIEEPPSMIDHFLDCLAASTDYVHAAITGTGEEQEITTEIVNPDIPRNISITSSANSTGDVIITGVDAKGNAVIDTITIVTGGIAYGVVAFSTISKITIPGTVEDPDTISVGVSDKLGLSNAVYAGADVYKVKVGGADKTGEFDMAEDVNTTYGTIDMSSLDAGGISAYDDITIWFKIFINS